MLSILGQAGKDLCDSHLRVSRRRLLQVGGSSLLGLNLAQWMRGQQQVLANTASSVGKPGFGRAKSVIMVYLQGGPSHLDLWDPKDDVPDNVRSVFMRIPSKVTGMDLTENLPRFAQVTDKLTLIRSMSYSPNGLFNHTAAIYQMHTGYTADKVSPSGQLEPPNPKDFPTFGSNIIRMKPPEVPMLPFVMLPRPLQESGVVGKGGTAGFLGRAFDPYTLYPPGDDMDMSKMDRINIDDLQLRPDVSSTRLERRARLRDLINEGMPDIDRAVAKYDLDEYYDSALSLIVSGRAREAFDLRQESDALRERYGRNTFGQSCLAARRLIESGSKFVTINHGGWDTHKNHFPLMRRQLPELDRGLGTLIADLDERGLLDSTIVWCVGEFGRTPKVAMESPWNGGRHHFGAVFSSLVAGGGFQGGQVVGQSDARGESVKDRPVYPGDLIGTLYELLGIDPDASLPHPMGEFVRATPGEDEGMESGGRLNEIM